jgi:hypothetical protein
VTLKLVERKVGSMKRAIYIAIGLVIAAVVFWLADGMFPQMGFWK